MPEFRIVMDGVLLRLHKGKLPNFRPLVNNRILLLDTLVVIIL